MSSAAFTQSPHPASPGAAPSLLGWVGGLAIRLGEPLLGGRFARAYGDLEQAQWLPPEKLLRRTEERLAPLLRHAAEHVPFYREIYRREGWSPDALAAVSDLRRLPTVSKAVFRSQPEAAFLAENLPAHRRLEWTTSGSTGEPFRFYLDRQGMPLVFASHLFYDSWFGLRPFDRYVRLMAPPVPEPKLPDDTPLAARLRYRLRSRLQSYYEKATQLRISLFDVDAERAAAVVRQIREFRPSYILGYTSTLATIAEEVGEREPSLGVPLKGVVTIAETLTPHRRRSIESFFQAPIINRWGQREFKYWAAQSCPLSPEQFHINTELVAWEVLREDGSPAAPGETGRLVLTNLSNYVMPFIRYETGDLAAYSAEPCPCGRGFPVISKLEGRSLECLRTPSGKLINPVSLGQYLFVTKGYVSAVRHYQLVEEPEARVRLLVVPGEGWSAQERQRLEKDMSELLGPGTQAMVQTVEEIPLEKSGKRPIIRTLSGTRR